MAAPAPSDPMMTLPSAGDAVAIPLVTPGTHDVLHLHPQNSQGCCPDKQFKHACSHFNHLRIASPKARTGTFGYPS